MRFLFIPFFIAMLIGCAHVPVGSLLKLRQLDVLTVDPGAIKVAIAMPDEIRIVEGGAVLHFGVKESTAGEARSESFTLEQETLSTGPSFIPGAAGISGHITEFRISETDISRIRALQTDIAGRKARYPNDLEGFISVDAKGCLQTADLPDKLPMTTWLKTDNEQAFFVLTKDVDLTEIMTAEELSRELQPC